VRVLQHLAVNDSNEGAIAQAGAIPLLVQLLRVGTLGVKTRQLARCGIWGVPVLQYWRPSKQGTQPKRCSGCSSTAQRRPGRLRSTCWQSWKLTSKARVVAKLGMRWQPVRLRGRSLLRWWV
jgi:hypothetical protein